VPIKTIRESGFVVAFMAMDICLKGLSAASFASLGHTGVKTGLFIHLVSVSSL